MKPDCQQVLTQFASFSVEELSDSEAADLLQHIEDCEPCKGQWLLFEKSLTVVTQSGPRDEDIEQHLSQQMWLVCMEHARKNVEKPAFKAHAAPAAPSHDEQHNEPAAPAKIGAHAQNKAHAQSKEPAKEGSVLVAPRIGMTLVGGALLFLASSYWLAPKPASAPTTALPPMPAQLQTVGFNTLPRAAAPLVDYGATLGFNGLSDRVAPALIAAPIKKLGKIQRAD